MRRWRDEDREPFAQLNADPEVMRYFPEALDREASDALVERIETDFDANGFGLWALEVVDSGEFLGFTGLSIPRFDADFLPAVEVGWRLKRQAWGHGYASEAAREALRIGFEDFQLKTIMSFTAAINSPSRAVMERIGLTYVKNFEHPNIAAGSLLSPHVLYEIDRAEWARTI